MKRELLFSSLLAAALWLPAALCAQNSPTAIAERDEAEARYTRLNTKVQELEETLQSHQQRIMKLTEEVHHLNEEVDRLKNKNEGAATQESFKQLAEKIEEVDRKRRADNELVIGQLKTLSKAAVQKPPSPEKVAPVPTNSKAPPANGGPTVGPGDKAGSPPAVPENGYEYTIKQGDRLDKIVAALRARDMKITQKQVMDANQGVNWSKLKIGQKIFIPAATP